MLLEMERRREGGRCMLQFESSPFSAAGRTDNSAEYRSVIDPKVSLEIHSFFRNFQFFCHSDLSHS